MTETSKSVDSIAGRLERIRLQIAEAAIRSNRDPSQIELVAVSKAFPVEKIEEAKAAGQVDFGENRVQELVAKAEAVDARWHFIGRLQRNKVGKVVTFAHVIHSVDSLPLAQEIEARAAKANKSVQVLIEVNVSGEQSKGGVEPPQLAALVEAVLAMEKVKLAGLMTMAPRSTDPERARPVFRRLAELRDELARAYSCDRIRHLSMGMSQDYRVAVEEGSTLVRVGEAIFGARARRAENLSDTER